MAQRPALSGAPSPSRYARTASPSPLASPGRASPQTLAATDYYQARMTFCSVVKKLVEYGAKVTQRLDDYRVTPLGVAAERGASQIARHCVCTSWSLCVDTPVTPALDTEHCTAGH